jgi:hypothetical protein
MQTKKFRQKKRNTQMDTIEKMYGRNFGVKNDKQLCNYLKEKGCNSLSQLLQND